MAHAAMPMRHAAPTWKRRSAGLRAAPSTRIPMLAVAMASALAHAAQVETLRRPTAAPLSRLTVLQVATGRQAALASNPTSAHGCVGCRMASGASAAHCSAPGSTLRLCSNRALVWHLAACLFPSAFSLPTPLPPICRRFRAALPRQVSGLHSQTQRVLPWLQVPAVWQGLAAEVLLPARQVQRLHCWWLSVRGRHVRHSRWRSQMLQRTGLCHQC